VHGDPTQKRLHSLNQSENTKTVFVKRLGKMERFLFVTKKLDSRSARE